MAELANKLANRLVKIVINFPVIKPVTKKQAWFQDAAPKKLYLNKEEARRHGYW
jgi:hypothetical protein